jgi:YVTN family beta-propeller protein
VRLSTVDASGHRVLDDATGRMLAGSIAVAKKPNSAGQRIVAVPLIYDNELAVADTATGKVIGRVKTGVAPFGAVVDESGTVAWVSNWGGPVPGPNARTAPLGYNPNADRVIVDARGAAGAGTVSRIDLVSMKVTHTVNVDPHPNAMAWDEKRSRLYVASSHRDSVAVVDTRTNLVLAYHSLAAVSAESHGDFAHGGGALGRWLEVICCMRRD